MKHTINKIVLQGRAGPSRLRLTPEGQVFASILLQIEDLPNTTIMICGIGGNALFIADGEPGDHLNIEGELAFDAARKRFYVFAHTARRMTEQDGALVPLAPSMKVVDRFEKLFLDEAP